MIIIFSLTCLVAGVACTNDSQSESFTSVSSSNSVENSTSSSYEHESSEDSNVDKDSSLNSSIEEDSSSSSNEQISKNPSDYVDFIVDVEGGREIRVLQLTDIQTIDPSQKRYPDRISGSEKTNTYEKYEKYINQVIKRYDPDFIIMTGDNVYGEFDDSGEQFLHLISYMESFQIPWAPIFGNHDNESNMGVDWQCAQLEAAEYCLFKQRTLTGNGNYSVGLTQDGELKRVFYMLDSNGCSKMSSISLENGHSTTTVGFGQDQIDWYTDSVTLLKKAFPNIKLSMAFHIQLSIFEKGFEKYQITTSDMPIDIEQFPASTRFGDFGHVGAKMKSPWDSDYKVWNSLKLLGFDSIFVGHEHKNSSSILYQGIRLTYGQKSSTYDRYNTKDGKPVMGGTYINLSKDDGAIAGMGLYLYDPSIQEDVDSPVEDVNPPIEDDVIPETAITTVLDFNGEDFNTQCTTETIKSNQASIATTDIPEGASGVVYAHKSSNFAAVGIQFEQSLNIDKVYKFIARVYVSEYTIKAGKTPVFRIYDNTTNTIRSESTFEELGGKVGEWCELDILSLIKSAQNVTDGEELNPFTLVYRFYGESVGIIYFDSITLISEEIPFSIL